MMVRRRGGVAWSGCRSVRRKRSSGLSTMGLPSRLIGEQIGRHHRTVWGYLWRVAAVGCGGVDPFAVAVVVG